MRRGFLFLVAAFIEVLRFFSLMLFAEAIGFIDSGSLTPSLLRYVAVPQLLFAVVFFFLWLDGQRYTAFRPLALLGKAISLVAFVPLLLAFFGSIRSEGFIPLPNFALGSAFYIVAADIFGMLVLALYRRALIHGAPSSGSARSGDGDSPMQGPEDIEKVEALP
jgi:hypothetical protein